MSQVKKAFQPIADLLEANKDKKVSEILGSFLELAKAQVNRTTGEIALYDNKGKVVGLYDYFLKRWMPLVGPKAVEFGPKAGTSTGYQGMSKLGLSAYTSQQRIAKNAELALLPDVIAGNVKPEEIPAKQAEIEAARTATPTQVTDTETKEVIEVSKLGFATQDELKSYLTTQNVKLGEKPAAPAASADKKAA